MSKAFVLLVAALLSLNCSEAASNTQQTLKVSPSPTATPSASQDKLGEEVKRIAAQARGRVGAAVMIVETGETIVALNAAERFPMQSVYKLPIGMAVLSQVDREALKLGQKVRVEKGDYVGAGMHSPIRDRHPRGTELSVEELLRFAISESDGTASDVLLRLAGGAESVTKYLRDLRVEGIAVINTEKEIGEDHSLQYKNWATPESVIVLLRTLQEGRGLSPESRALMLKVLVESRPGPRRLKGRLPWGTVVAHKTGSSGAENGIAAATNDVGLITLPDGRHLAIAVFVSDSPADEAVREGVIAEIARAAWDWSVQAR